MALSLYIYTTALHWVPIPMPMPTHTHGFWVGMGAILLFMGFGWAWVLCIPASSSISESNFSDAGNTLTNKHFGLKPHYKKPVFFFMFQKTRKNV
jgi:hypothetical protein